MSGLGGLWACVRACDCGGVGAVGCARGQRVAACPSRTPSFVKDCGYQLMASLSPQDLGVYMGNPPRTPASHSLLSPSPPTLRPYRTPALRLLSDHTFRCPFLSDPEFFLLLLSFLYIRALTSRAPPGHRLLYSLPTSSCPSVVVPAWQAPEFG